MDEIQIPTITHKPKKDEPPQKTGKRSAAVKSQKKGKKAEQTDSDSVSSNDEDLENVNRLHSGLNLLYSEPIISSQASTQEQSAGSSKHVSIKIDPTTPVIIDFRGLSNHLKAVCY